MQNQIIEDVISPFLLLFHSNTKILKVKHSNSTRHFTIFTFVSFSIKCFKLLWEWCV